MLYHVLDANSALWFATDVFSGVVDHASLDTDGKSVVGRVMMVVVLGGFFGLTL